jgi:hypothetical protein
VSAAYWRRKGEEAETEDHRAGNSQTTDRVEAWSALAAWFDGDLPTGEAEREEALDEATAAYIAQAKSRAS